MNRDELTYSDLPMELQREIVGFQYALRAAVEELAEVTGKTAYEHRRWLNDAACAVAAWQLERAFPRYDYKPINRDKCWGELQRMAGIDSGPSITCPVCGRTSYNANDILHRYCGSCHQYHDLMAMQAELETAQQGGDRNA